MTERGEEISVIELLDGGTGLAHEDLERCCAGFPQACQFLMIRCADAPMQREVAIGRLLADPGFFFKDPPIKDLGDREGVIDDRRDPPCDGGSGAVTEV